MGAEEIHSNLLAIECMHVKQKCILAHDVRCMHAGCTCTYNVLHAVCGTVVCMYL